MNWFGVVLPLSVMLIQINKSYECRYFKTKYKKGLDGIVELQGAVSDITTRSRITCLSKCSFIGKCLSFFYNQNTGRCVMHSKDFIWQTPNITEFGWKFYITEDVSGRCPAPNYFYRHLDFCYNVNTIPIIDSDEIKTSCTNKGGKVATITSQEFEDYFLHFLNGRPDEYIRVFLAGTVQTNRMVTLDNGTLLTYYNWYSGQPDNKERNEWCLELYTDSQWWDVPCYWSRPAAYVCEIL